MIKYNSQELIPVYNMEKVFFYVEHGIRPIDNRPRINNETGSVFFLFTKKDTNKLYSLWKQNRLNK